MWCKITKYVISKGLGVKVGQIKEIKQSWTSLSILLFWQLDLVLHEIWLLSPKLYF